MATNVIIIQAWWGAPPQPDLIEPFNLVHLTTKMAGLLPYFVRNLRRAADG